MTRITVVIASNRKINIGLNYEPKSKIKQAKDTILHPVTDMMIISNSNFHFFPNRVMDNGVNTNLIGAQSDIS